MYSVCGPGGQEKEEPNGREGDCSFRSVCGLGEKAIRSESTMAELLSYGSGAYSRKAAALRLGVPTPCSEGDSRLMLDSN